VKRKLKPIARFRVYAWKSSLYFMVHIWRTKKDMLDNRVSLGLPRLRDCDAHVFSYDVFRCRKGQRDRKLPIVGDIHFYKSCLGTEAITHESFHATASLLRRLKFDFTGLNNEGVASTMRNKLIDKEEVVAKVQGKLAREIVTKLYNLKLIP
jgi:hypothetical protein